jgi:glucans biosynthesis protein C
MQATSSATGRQYGLDWLRIGAFGILILYHIGMFFVPWGWHVKTAVPVAWVEWPMMAVNPWRLSLLFLISGIVSRALLAKLGAPGRFAGSRSARLLIPLLAGMAIFVVPQPWVELRDRGVYTKGLLHFWLHDYAEFGASRGTPLPTWNHLWFVAYLWLYSMLLAGLALLPTGGRAALQAGFDRAFAGWRLFVLPIAWLVLARALLLPLFGETHALVDDPYAHAVYGFAFFFGVGLARADAAWQAIDRDWRLALAAAALGCALTFLIHESGADTEPLRLLRAATRALLAWGAILGLLGLARRHLDRDGPARRYLTEAIFPYYIVHQTIIVVTGHALKQAGVGRPLEFAGILLATLVGCALTYEIARRVSGLRPILGLKRLARRPDQSAGAVASSTC